MLKTQRNIWISKYSLKKVYKTSCTRKIFKNYLIKRIKMNKIKLFKLKREIRSGICLKKRSHYLSHHILTKGK